MRIEPSIEQLHLQFGYKREEVKAALGEPSSVEVIEVSDHANLDCWTYDAHRMELIFDSESGYRLSSLSLSSKKVTVDGVKIIGLKEKKLLKKFPDLRCEDEKDDIGYHYEYPGENLMFWVSEGVVRLLTFYA